jgi:omega-hydroxy-beta-dihydromenaquinone-9 sulfotransferase
MLNTSQAVDDRKQIFIVGNSRSGTTMLGRIIGQNSKVFTFDELHFFDHQVDAAAVSGGLQWNSKQLVTLLVRLFTSSRDSLFAKPNNAAYEAEAVSFLKEADDFNPIAVYRDFLHYESNLHNKEIPCEQTPGYLYFLDEILKAFPNAVIVNMVRDPRDVLVSQKNKWRRMFLGGATIPLNEAFRSWTNYHPLMTSKLWVSAVRIATTFQSHPRFTSVRFEDLLSNPEQTVRGICSFANLEFEASMLNVPQVGSSAGTDNPKELGINKDRAQAWLKGGLTSTEIDICQRATKAEMRDYGYTPEDIRVSWLSLILSGALLALKGFLALLMNIKRTKNLKDMLLRRIRTAK